jgi:hypothetical protein
MKKKKTFFAAVYFAFEIFSSPAKTFSRRFALQKLHSLIFKGSKSLK